MTEDPLDACHDFLSRYIESFEDLTALLMVADRGSFDARALDAAPGARVSAEALARLVGTGLLAERDGVFVLAELAPQVARGLEELRRQYRTAPVEVMSRMNANAIDRVRTAALRAFARAFVLSRKSDG